MDGSIYYYVFNTLLFCLLVLNIYWWVLMLRMLVGQIRARGKVSEDIRSGKLKDLFRIWLFSVTFLLEKIPAAIVDPS